MFTFICVTLVLCICVTILSSIVGWIIRVATHNNQTGVEILIAWLFTGLGFGICLSLLLRLKGLV